jgi:hypothetical protein
MQELSEADAGIAEVPPDCLAGFTEHRGGLVAAVSLDDAFHDLSLRRWQEAEDVGRPFVVFRCRQPTVLGTFLGQNVAALDETLDYALVPARPGLDVVIDHCPARVRERAGCTGHFRSISSMA